MLTTTHLNQVGNFDQDTTNELGRALGTKEALIAAGALSLNTYHSTLAVSSTMAFTLAAPTVSGQRKKVTAISAASTPAATLTVSSPDDTTGFVCPATFFFDNTGQEIELEATPALKWRCIRKKRVGWKTLVIGTTVTTGIADMSHLNLSVTGTVTSTGTKGIPAGAAVGERLLVGCGTAALTPHGDIFGTAFLSTSGGTANTLDDFTATTDHMEFEWTGAAWQLISNNTTAVTLTTV